MNGSLADNEFCEGVKFRQGCRDVRAHECGDRAVSCGVAPLLVVCPEPLWRVSEDENEVM